MNQSAASAAMEADYSLIAFLHYFHSFQQTFHEAKKHRQQQGGVISFTREEAFLVSQSVSQWGSGNANEWMDGLLVIAFGD